MSCTCLGMGISLNVWIVSQTRSPLIILSLEVFIPLTKLGERGGGTLKIDNCKLIRKQIPGQTVAPPMGETR